MRNAIRVARLARLARLAIVERWASSAVVSLVLLTTGCAGLQIAGPDSGGGPSPTTQRRAPASEASVQRADSRDVERLTRIMVPLLRAANHPIPLDKARVGIANDPSINAGSAGSGQFIVTRGLLDRANDEQLQAVLAHEVAHDDLGHVGKQQRLGTGLEVGAAILDQIFPGTGQIAPIAGTLILQAYSRREELEADRHGVELLQRIGAPPESMEQTLVWLKGQTGGGSGGGFFATHPGTDERIAALRRFRGGS
jgi:Zn-dependent protease with chaperone function